jgi:hypothetical protein
LSGKDRGSTRTPLRFFAWHCFHGAIAVMTAASPFGDTRAAWLLAAVEFFFALRWGWSMAPFFPNCWRVVASTGAICRGSLPLTS